MTRPFKLFLAFLFGLPLIVAALVVINFYIISHLLRIDRDLLAAVRGRLVPVAEPLVLVASEDRACQSARDWFALLRVQPRHLPSTHPLVINITWIQRANPYPPLIAEISGGYGSYCSFGYLGVDGRYHQITVYGGESDTLPSFLVEKVRGSATFWGDYFIHYLFILSRERELTDTNGRSYYPQIDAVEWGSFRGGSYDGLEEIFGNALATMAELSIIGIVAVLVLARRKREESPEGTRASSQGFQSLVWKHPPTPPKSRRDAGNNSGRSPF